MIKFGSSGTGDLFLQEGGSGKTVDVPSWLKSKNLDCYEYSFGRGAILQESACIAIADAFCQENIEISVHAPYFINLACDDDKVENNISYFLSSLKRLKLMGGKRMVFHPGALKKMDRRTAMNLACERLDIVLAAIFENGYSDVTLGVESMGKIAQLGDCQEIIELCKKNSMLVPCIDFGHQNARTQGGLASKDDYRRLMDAYLQGLGYDKVNRMHVHFSKIMYTKMGEVKHLTFEDNIYGPCFEPLAEILVEYKLEPYIICESAGTQAVDAMYMKNYFNSLLN